MRALGLDVGDKRIGIAVSDLLGITAQGLPTLERIEEESDIQTLVNIIKEKEVDKVIVGLPRNMNGTYGPQSEKVKAFISLLKDRVEAEFVFWDERLTTVAAQRTLLQGDVSRKKRKKVVDKLAAVMILQSYLDRISF